MSDRVILVSNDTDFFEFIRTKLSLRRYDEIFCFDFEQIIQKLDYIKNSVIIINSESSKEQALDFLKLIENSVAIVVAYNDDNNYKIKCFKNGAFDFITLMISNEDFLSKMNVALNVCSILKKQARYRELLVDTGLVGVVNDIFLNYGSLLDRELEKIFSNKQKAVFIAISPAEKDKFIINHEMIEVIILNEVRKNDIIMNYAAGKYFLLMYDIDKNNAETVMQKIVKKLPQKLYYGITNITNQKRQQLISETLNKLHEQINIEKNSVIIDSIKKTNNNSENKSITANVTNNFKAYRADFENNFTKIISPAFYTIQQRYQPMLSSVLIEHSTKNGVGLFFVKSKIYKGCVKISTMGFSKVIIEISSQKGSNDIDSKRITLDIDELEQNVIEDLLEQFVLEYKQGGYDEYS